MSLPVFTRALRVIARLQESPRLLADMAEQSSPRTESGNLLGDLKDNAQLVQRTLADQRQGALFKAVIAAAACDPKAAEALHRFYETRINEWAPCVEQAIDRGEVPEGTDTREVIRAVSDPLYYRSPAVPHSTTRLLSVQPRLLPQPHALALTGGKWAPAVDGRTTSLMGSWFSAAV